MERLDIEHRLVDPDRAQEEIADLVRHDLRVSELERERHSPAGAGAGAIIVVLAVRDALRLRRALTPLVPAGSANHLVEVAINVDDLRIVVPRSTKADVRPRRSIHAKSRDDAALIEDETTSGSVASPLLRGNGVTILIWRNGRVEEVALPSSEDEVNVTLNVRLEGEHESANVEGILVAIDLASVHEGILAALDRKAKRRNVCCVPLLLRKLTLYA